MKFFWHVIALLLMTLGLVGCGGDTPSPTISTSATTASIPATTVASKTIPAPAVVTAATTTVVTNGATATPGASGLTMKEAYTAAEPQIKLWQPDQVLFSIFNSLDSGVGINPEGRSAEWNFQAVSVGLNKRATWLVKAGADGKPGVTKTGEEQISPADAKNSPALPGVNSLIDSSQLMTVAQQNGGDKSDNPVGFFLRQPIKVGDPLAVDLVFYKGNEVVSLRIDMQSGKIVPNVKG